MGPKKHRWRLRFGLRGVLIAVLAMCVALAYVASVREQREAMRCVRLSNPSATLLYEYQLDAAAHLNHDGQAPGPRWLRERVGVDSLESVTGADMFYPTDRDMEQLTRFPKLRRLVAERCIDLTDAGMKTIGEMSSLEYLVLGEADQVTDVGLLKLARLKYLKELRMDLGRQMTMAGVERLREQMPWCTIKVRTSPDEPLASY
jgi:hypothetical protein